jgi:arabinofuranosyltransferase
LILLPFFQRNEGSRLPAGAAAALVAGVATALLLIHTTHLTWFTCDDAYISFRYATHLADNGVPEYNTGEAVEGYSNFLWVVLLAGAHKLTLPLTRTAWLFSSLAAFWALFSLALLIGRALPPDRELPLRRVLVPGGLLAAVVFGPFAFWVSTGMETMLFGALLTAGVASTVRARNLEAWPWRPALLWAACALTRPEGVFLGAAALSWHLFFTWKDARFSLRPLVRPAAGLVLFFSLVGTHFLWRRLTYGQWLPMTYHTKISGIDPGFLFRHGRAYAHAFFSTYHLYWFLPLLAGVALPGTGRRLPGAGRVLLLTTGLSLLLLAHIVRSGGDFMAQFRFFTPAWPLILASLLLGIAGWATWLGDLVSRKSPSPGRFLPSWVIGAIPLLIFLIVTGVSSWRFTRASLASERTQFMMESIRGMVNFARDREKVGRALRALLPARIRQRTVMVVGGAGAIAHESGIGRVVDTFGLTDPEIAKMKIKTGTFSKPGHLKQASWSHVRAKDADILCNPNVAWIGRGPPTERTRAMLERSFPGTVTFCLVLPLSSPGRGSRRSHYCCLRKKDRLEQLTLRTVVP